MKATAIVSLIFASVALGQQTQGQLTNQRIGDMLLAGVSQSEIIRVISSAPAISFDLRPGSTDNLLKVGVSEDIIKAMAAREMGITVAPDMPTATVDPAAQPVTRFAESTPMASANGSRTRSSALIAPASPLPNKTQLIVTAGSSRVIPHQNSYDFQLPGHSVAMLYTGRQREPANKDCIITAASARTATVD